MQRLAAIDVGSNTLRLLIAEGCTGASPRALLVQRRITRLGENFLPSRILLPQSMERSVAALQEFSNLMAGMGVSHYRAGATAVVREARNARQFLKMVRDQVGLQVRVLSGAEEARLSLRGVATVVPAPEAPLVVFDIGGGSTELIWRQAGKSGQVESRSLALGVVHLTEAFLRRDPPGREACSRVRRQVRSSLLQAGVPQESSEMLWSGTAGTVTTLASMRLALEQYDQQRIDGTVLERSWLEKLCDTLAEMPIARRRELPGLEPGREDIILAGALLVLELMDTFGFSRFTVSDAGLLEGLLLDLCDELSAAEDIS